MPGSFLKLVFRNSTRNKGRTFINIAGLTVGLACSILIALWIQDEINFDSFHENIDDIYRLYQKDLMSEGVAYSNVLPAPIAPAIKRAVPGISNYARIYFQTYSVEHDNRNYILNGAVVDSSFLEMFSFDLIKGDKNSSLSEINSVIFTEDAAAGIFGEENPVGSMVTIDGSDNLMITGVAAGIPSNSSLLFDFLVPISLMEANGYDMSNWGDSRFMTFIQLADKSSLSEIRKAIKHFEQTRWPETESELHLQSFSDLHLHDLGGGGHITYIYIFSSIALIIILIASINFINLTIAAAFGRFKEIGIKKVVGANRTQLILHFMGETFLIVTVSLIAAWGLIELVLPEYNNFTGKAFSFDIINSPAVFCTSLGIVLLTVLLSGSYPALFLSSLQPISLINKAALSGRISRIGLIRRGLVIFQFILSVGLMISTITIYNQMNYIKVKDLGLNEENIVCVRMDNLSDDYQTIKQELLLFPEILNATATLNPPAWMSVSTAGAQWEGKEDEQRFNTALFFVDMNFIETFGIEMAAGRPFSEEFSTDRGNSYVVNEAAVKAMDLDSPIGTEFSWNDIEGEIIGVTRNFHFESLHSEIRPMAMLVLDWYNYLCIKVDANNLNRAIEIIENTFAEFRPNQEFKYKYFGEFIDNRYRSEEKLFVMIKYFAILAIVIACLGLFGLTSLMTERKIKEIGIRKVLGASITGIVMLLSKDFMRWIIIANVIVWPIAYYVMNRWLGNFAYHVEIGLTAFALSALVTSAVALMTISIQAIRAARANPVDTLRYE